MKSHGRQPDLIRNSPPELAQAFRVAADTERRNPYYPPDEAEKRAAYYERQAQALEQRAVAA